MPTAFSPVRSPRWVPSSRRRERTDQRLKILEVEIKGDSGPAAKQHEEGRTCPSRHILSYLGTTRYARLCSVRASAQTLLGVQNARRRRRRTCDGSPRITAESGELTPRRVGPIESAFTDQARELVVDWQRDGGYERALVAIAAADPDLAVQ